jgi:hypothetical protein
MFGKDFGDFADLCEEGEFIMVLCEGCGEKVIVDHNGKNVGQVLE